MTVADLYSAVAQLGFETSLDEELEDDSAFYYAINRALLQVCKVRPVIKHYVVNHKPLKNLITKPVFDPIEKDDDLTFEAMGGKSYYFEADGNGAAYIEVYDSDTQEWTIIDSVTLSSNGAFVAYKGFIKPDGEFTDGYVRIRFTGEYFYSVKNVAIYKHILSDSTGDIPACEQYTRYDISALASDFMELCCPPIKEGADNAVLNQDYEVEGGTTILLPRSKRGIYKVLYIHKPDEIIYDGDAITDETVLDLDDELSSLMPLITAAYIWVDGEPTKAEYYMNLYRERVQDIELRAKTFEPVKMRDVNGW